MLKSIRTGSMTKFTPAGSVKTSAAPWAGPYEGSRELNDIEGFVTPPASPCPTTIWTCSLYGCALWTRWELTE